MQVWRREGVTRGHGPGACLFGLRTPCYLKSCLRAFFQGFWPHIWRRRSRVEEVGPCNPGFRIGLILIEHLAIWLGVGRLELHCPKMPTTSGHEQADSARLSFLVQSPILREDSRDSAFVDRKSPRRHDTDCCAAICRWGFLP